MTTPEEHHNVSMTINGRKYRASVEARKTLADFIREDAHLSGTKLGCEHGVCGSCTILLDDAPARSCLTLAVQADGHRIRTVESLNDGPELNPLQRAFREQHGLQCGFCTAGFLMTATALLEDNPAPSRDDIVETVSGSLCRCTGYQTIISAIEQAAAEGQTDTDLDADANLDGTTPGESAAAQEPAPNPVPDPDSDPAPGMTPSPDVEARPRTASTGTADKAKS